MKILKVFNNNVVLAEDPSRGTVVLTGRGLGFQAHPGQPVDESRIVQVFVPDDGHPVEQLQAFLTDIPPEHIELARQVLALARDELGLVLTQAMVIPLADHLSFAVKRVRQGIVLEYPLQAEVTHLYPRELKVARRAVALVRERTGVAVVDEEAYPIALHLVNASIAGGDLSRTLEMTTLFTQIFDVLEVAYGRRFDTTSVSAARFLTHLRYFFVRLDAGTQLDEPPSIFTQATRDSFPEAYAAALKVRALLELRLGVPVTPDEETYLTLHIARLAAE